MDTLSPDHFQTEIVILPDKWYYLQKFRGKQKMPALNKENLEKYLTSLYKGNVIITSINEIGREGTEELKGFGYGVPYIIRFSVNNEVKSVVLETM